MPGDDRAMMSRSTDGEILQPQPPPWLKSVRRKVAGGKCPCRYVVMGMAEATFSFQRCLDILIPRRFGCAADALSGMLRAPLSTASSASPVHVIMMPPTMQ